MTDPLGFRERFRVLMEGQLPEYFQKQLIEAVSNEVATRAFREGFEVGSMQGNDEPPLSTPDGRTLSTGYSPHKQNPRDLSAVSQEKAMQAAYRLWCTHPLGRALIEILVDYIVGDGIVLDAKDEKVGEVLTKFIEDPVNMLNGRGLEDIARELLMFGEQIIVMFVRSGIDKNMVADGRVHFGTIDPTQIFGIATNPVNRREALAVVLKGEHGGIDGPVYKIIREKENMLEGVVDLGKWHAELLSLQEAEDNGVPAEERPKLDVKSFQDRLRLDAKVLSEVEGTIENRKAIIIEEADYSADGKGVGEGVDFEGECFLVQINKLSTGVRGRPELLPMLDWLDRLDTLFFDSAEHVALLNMFLWDLNVQGGSNNDPDPEKNLRVLAKRVAAAKANSVFAHNENVEIEAKTPELRTAQLETIIRQLRVFIAGGVRVPEHWIAEGGYTNRATAAEMGQPTFRMLSRKQAVVREVLTDMCRYQVDVLVQLGLLEEEVPILDDEGKPTGETQPAREAFKIYMPDVNVEDTGAAASAFAALAGAVLPLISANILPHKEGLTLLAQLAEELGVTLDVEKIIEEMADAEIGQDQFGGVNDLMKALKAEMEKKEKAKKPGAEEPEKEKV